VGVRILQELWANEISAELAVDAPTMEELLTGYKNDNHSWIVIVKQDGKDRGFKVKSLAKREDFDVRGPELVGWLHTEIRARNQRERHAEPIKLSKHPNQQDPNTAARERDPDVRILTSQHKSKKTNRSNIIEAGGLYFCPGVFLYKSFSDLQVALLRSRELIDKALNSPIAAIDTRDDVLEAIRNTRLSDPDSWRTVIQNAPVTERKYLGSVHELLNDLANEGADGKDGREGYVNAFIYNHRTGSCIYYDLSRSN